MPDISKENMKDTVQQPLTAIQINEDTYRIEDGGVRCLLFIGTGYALLIDTGFGNNGSVKDIVTKLTDKPVILVTSHADPDHIGNNAEFAETHLHPAEMAGYRKNAGDDAKAVAIWEGDIIDIGGRQFEVILIPGHTPGSIALLDRKGRIIVTGDSVSEGPVFMFDERRSIHAYISSMEKLQKLSDAFDEIYPSHGPFPVKPGQIKKAITAAQKLLAGEIEPTDPPFPLPAKTYMYDGAGFFY